jgi:alkylation response protein AidB-like acyl-CoA dehydrogenase
VIPGKIEKMGYKGVDTTELIFAGYRTSPEQILGATPGRGFYQMMDGVEVGRVNVAARGCGVALRAFELAVGYAQQRTSFGKQIAQHQAIQFRLADMATKVEAAHQMMVMAARKKDSGQRNDLEAGMAKYLAAEYCRDVVEDSLRIHGGYGFSKEYEIERLYRDVPMLLIGEGTSDIQKMIIGRRILEDYRLR